MLRRSPYRHRYLYASVVSFLLVAVCVFILLDTFVIARAEQPLMTGPAVTVATPTPDPSPTPVETVYTDTEYTDANIQIHVTEVVENNLRYYVADVELNSLAYFKSAFAYDTFGRNMRENTSDMALDHDAIFAVNGDYYGYRNTGIVIRNGMLYRDEPRKETLALLQDGTLFIAEKSITGEDLIEMGALQSWSFGPTLVIDGEYADRETTIGGRNPRTGIGMIEPFHYIFIVVDGRQDESGGITMEDFAQLFINYGCTVAYNLDGGGSSTMVMHDKVVNQPCYGEERDITDIIYIGYQ